MAQLASFIPATVKDCKRLIRELESDPEGATLADRYGRIDVLNAEEVKELLTLVRNQIGEPEPKPEAPTKVQAPKKPTAKKK